MVEPVNFNSSEIKFETGIRKDASLVMAVLQKNGKLPTGLTVQNIEAILNTLSPETCKPLIEAIVKHGSEDNLNASLKELGIIAEALKPGSTAKFAIENGKLKITKDKEFELIDGKDGESEGSRAALAEVTGDYDAFVKETLNIKPAPGAPPKVEAEKVKLAVKAPMTLDYFIGKVLEGKLSVDDLKEKRLPDDVESIFKTDKKISITDVEKIAILNMLGNKGYFGAAKEYEAGKKGVFSAEGIAFSFSGAGSAFRDEFFKTSGELLTVKSEELKSVVYSISRSFEFSQKMGRTTGGFEDYAKEFINASAYLTKTISSSEDGATANLCKKLSGSGGPKVTKDNLAGLAKAFARANLSQENLPISNGSGAQITLDPKDSKKVLLSVSDGGVFKPVMSFAKDDWDKIVDGTKDIKEGKDLWLLNFLEFMTQEKDDKVQTWENGKITDKTYIKEGKNIEIKDEVVDFKKVVDGITGIPPKIETLDMPALPPDASQPPPPAGTPPMSQPHPATGKQSIKLEGFVPPAGVTPDPRFGLLQGITVKDNYSNTYMIIEKKDVTPTTYHLVRMDINQKGAAFNKTPIPTGANTFNFQMGGLSVTKEFNVGALVPAPGGNSKVEPPEVNGRIPEVLNALINQINDATAVTLLSKDEITESYQKIGLDSYQIKKDNGEFIIRNSGVETKIKGEQLDYILSRLAFKSASEKIAANTDIGSLSNPFENVDTMTTPMKFASDVVLIKNADKYSLSVDGKLFVIDLQSAKELKVAAQDKQKELVNLSDGNKEVEEKIASAVGQFKKKSDVFTSNPTALLNPDTSLFLNRVLYETIDVDGQKKTGLEHLLGSGKVNPGVVISRLLRDLSLSKDGKVEVKIAGSLSKKYDVKEIKGLLEKILNQIRNPSAAKGQEYEKLASDVYSFSENTTLVMDGKKVEISSGENLVKILQELGMIK